MMLYARDVNGVLHVAETDENYEVLVHQQELVAEVGEQLGVKIVKPVLSVVD